MTDDDRIEALDRTRARIERLMRENLSRKYGKAEHRRKIGKILADEISALDWAIEQAESAP